MIASKYVLEELLGQGGMGDVWVARNLALDVAVALKLIRRDVYSSDAAERLLEEARAEAQVMHPAIVRVFDFGTTDDGAPFIVMELLDGRSLGDMLREQAPLDAVTAVQILLPVLDGLIAAHERGIVHRDLTPENIFLAREARRVQPKILDFGIAFVEWCPVRRQSKDGTVAGNPRYMSPEQARGLADVDHRTDLWTMCVVLYVAITGRAPFEGPDWTTILKGVTEEAPSPIDGIAADEALLWRIIEKGLMKDPAMRWQSADELGRALAEWLSSVGVHQDVRGGAVDELWLPERACKAPGVLHDALPLRLVRAEADDLRTDQAEAPDSKPVSKSPAGVVLSTRPGLSSGPFLTYRPTRAAMVMVLLGSTVVLPLVLASWRVGTSGAHEAEERARPALSRAASPAPTVVTGAAAPGVDTVSRSAPERGARPPSAPVEDLPPRAVQAPSGRQSGHGLRPAGNVPSRPSGANPLQQTEPLDLKEPYR